ncbi:uncharacterized protein LOC115213182 [Octopus sinensis]|uniref:Uncharacterized protein LOC115213182 n=1 Tax=Octopus sinensis TaxID=2607531 RepID=A0A6P7SJ09_9MOLL|nr:uncharacterized protein LOC115213182 [Octopus sinensis]
MAPPTRVPLHSSDGQDLPDNTSILARWSEHFQSLFSANRTIQDAAILRIPQLPLKEELNKPPTLEETIEAIGKLKSHKAAGVDDVPPKIWKNGGPMLHDFLVCCWEQSKLPQDLRDTVIITLYKNKGEKSDCFNYWGITLLSIAGKVLARILLNRLVSTIAEENLPKSQCGLRANRGTTDMVFVLCQLQEKCQEQNRGLCAAFVDLTKAFDTVSRTELWLILERPGCPTKFLQMCLQAHTKTQERLIQDLLFIDDAVLVAHTERALQRITSCLADASRLFGLAVSLKKTEVLHQPTPQEDYHPPHITICGTKLKSTQQFTYLGCIISFDARIDKEIENRLSKANRSFGRLYKRVWHNNNLKNKTKISVYRAVVLTTLLYGSETWITYRSYIRLLERFHQRCLRTILNIHWSDFITNIEVLERAEIPSIEAMLLKSHLRWAGHVSRMPCLANSPSATV